MRRSYITLVAVLMTAFLVSACCGLPEKKLSTESNDGFVKVTAIPADAEVYVDGTLQGKASDFDGKRQVLQLGSGRHKIEIRAEGYHSYTTEVFVGAGATENFNATLSKK